MRKTSRSAISKKTPNNSVHTENNQAQKFSLTSQYKYLYIVNIKPLKFIGSSEDDLAAFPREVQQVAGYQLFRVQAGLMPSDWKPMLNVGAGAYEIRVHV